jgi:hypothetical protein
MLQRTVPDFAPSEASHELALGVLEVLVARLAAAGVSDPDDVALVRSLMSGVVAEQIANDPGGRLFLDQTERGIRTLLTGIRRRR